MEEQLIIKSRDLLQAGIGLTEGRESHVETCGHYFNIFNFCRLPHVHFPSLM